MTRIGVSACACLLLLCLAAPAGAGARGEPTYRSPICIAFSPKGDLAYVTNHTAGSLSVIDAAKGEVTAETRVGRAPTGVAASPDGNWVYVADAGNQRQPGLADTVEAAVEQGVDADEGHAHAVERQSGGDTRQGGLVPAHCTVFVHEPNSGQSKNCEQRREGQRDEEYLTYPSGEVLTELIFLPATTWRERVGKSTVPMAMAKTPWGSWNNLKARSMIAGAGTLIREATMVPMSELKFTMPRLITTGPRSTPTFLTPG